MCWISFVFLIFFWFFQACMVYEDGVNWYQADTTIRGPLNVEGSQCKEECRKEPNCKIAPFQKMWTTQQHF